MLSVYIAPFVRIMFALCTTKLWKTVKKSLIGSQLKVMYYSQNVIYKLTTKNKAVITLAFFSRSHWEFRECKENLGSQVYPTTRVLTDLYL